MRLLGWCAASGLLSASALGCAVLFGFEELSDTKADAGTVTRSDGPAVEPPPDAEPAVAQWYVSAATGRPGATGSREDPIDTLREAVARADAASSSGPQRIAVCAGTYEEASLLLRSGVELYGGYDCVAWTRAPEQPERRGAPVSASVLLQTATPDVVDVFVQADGTAVQTDGGSAPRAVLDRLQITTGHARLAVFAARATLRGLGVRNETAPPAGGDLPGTTVGVLLDEEATLDHSTLEVDQGYAPPPALSTQQLQGTVGVLVIRGNPSAAWNDITLTRTLGHALAVVTTGGRLTVAENNLTIKGCVRPTPEEDKFITCGGEYISGGGRIESRRNQITFEQLGAQDGESRVVRASGITTNPGLVDSDGDTIVGPAADMSLTADAGAARGVVFQGYSLFSSGEVAIRNASVIARPGAATYAEFRGIYLVGTFTGPIAHNTIYYAAREANLIGAIVHERAAASQLDVRANWMMSGAPGASLFAADYADAGCGLEAWSSLAHNRYGGFDRLNASCSETSLAAMVDGAADNVQLACDASNCAALVEADDLLWTTGVRPAAAACPSLRVPLDPDVPADRAGTPRAAETTAGALGCP